MDKCVQRVDDLASAVHGETKDVNSEAVLGSEEWFVYASSWNLCSSQGPILMMRTALDLKLLQI